MAVIQNTVASSIKGYWGVPNIMAMDGYGGQMI